jgi:hypothetical protein
VYLILRWVNVPSADRSMLSFPDGCVEILDWVLDYDTAARVARKHAVTNETRVDIHKLSYLESVQPPPTEEIYAKWEELVRLARERNIRVRGIENGELVLE